jgi:hypothetical protein
MNSDVMGKAGIRNQLTLLDAVIIILISCSILIFVFTIGAKFLGQQTFDKLPDFIKDSYSAIWSAGVVAGGALVGSVVDALSKQASSKGNFVAYILGTTLLIMLLIVGTVELSRSIEGPQFSVPNGAKALDLLRDSTEPVDFYVQNKLIGGNQARITGSYTISKGQLKGTVANSELDPVAGLPAIRLSSISIHICYLSVKNGAPIYTQVPEFPTAANSEKIATSMNLSSAYAIPNFQFSINIRKLENIAPPYLCAFIDGDQNVHLTFY